MRNIIATILILLPTMIFAQETFENNILDRLCGLKVEGKAYLNLGEYAIFTDSVFRQFTPKNIKKLKKKYKLKKVKNESTFKGIAERNKVISKIEIHKGKFQKITTVYFIDKGNKIDVISFYSVNYRDTLEEQSLVKLYLENKIPESIFMKHPVSKVDFAGRKIELSSYCNWMNVNSVQCPYLGQMNWSLHQNLENAKKQTTTQYQITKGKGMLNLLSEDEVEIIFEGKETTAKRVKYNTKVPKVLSNGSNELIIYYVSEEIRGRFVSCILSHYSSNKVTKNGVPALLGEIMKLKD